MSTKKKTAVSKASFIESMECLPVASIPEGPEWTYEIKLDGFRLEVVKNAGEITLYSRRGNTLNKKFQYIADALNRMPEATILDGELVALDADDKSNFSLLQNFRSAENNIHYYAFDILMLKGRPLLGVSLAARREMLAKALPTNEHVKLSVVDHRADDILSFVRSRGLEGVVAKRSDSVYEPGKRSGLWSKFRLNVGQEFVVGGYTPAANGFDAIIIGLYQGKDLLFTARVRAGFIPASRRELFKRFAGLEMDKCPFANLPEKAAGRWGQGLTAEKMAGCRWLKPKMVVRVDFSEWTGANKLRHTQFVAMRDDKDPRKVVRET